MQWSEKRQFLRFHREYTVKFKMKDKDHVTYDVYKLLDIGRGGLRFFTYDHFELGTKLVFYIKFPFLYPNVTVVEGQVNNIQEVMAGKTYKMGVEFLNVTPEVYAALEKMENINLHQK